MDSRIWISAFRSIRRSYTNMRLSLLYCLEGMCRIQVQNRQVVLKSKDLLVVNPNTPAKIQMEQGLLLEITFDASCLYDEKGKAPKYIACDSTQNQGELMEQLKVLVDDLIRISPQSSLDQLVKERKGYDLLIFLLSYFASNSRNESLVLSRKEQIEAYIAAHYNQELSLDSIADAFGLSSVYFSKYFKETFGMPFLKYVSRYRLSQAIPWLMQTEKTILEICMETGFPNLNAFLSAFKEQYGITPGQFRSQYQKVEQKASLEEAGQALETGRQPDDENKVVVSCSVSDQAPVLKPYWFELLNAGSIEDLQQERNRNFLADICQSLPFRYARLFLFIPVDEPDWTFYREEYVLDYLYQLHLTPWIVIDFRQASARSDFLDWFHDFLAYFSNRYGQTANWNYELFYNSDFREESCEAYDDYAGRINAILDEFHVQTSLLGPGLQIDGSCDGLRNFLRLNTQISRLAVSLSPLCFHHENGMVYMEERTSPDYFLDDIQKMLEILPEEMKEEWYVISWKDSLYDYNRLNDTSYRAARLAQAYLSAYDLCRTLPIDTPFDLKTTSQHLFCGDAGLISPKGIRKPAFYALDFLNRLDRFVDYNSDQAIVTASTSRYLQIILIHCGHLSYQYYLHEHDQQSLKMSEFFAEDTEQLFHLHVTGLDDGDYILKQRRIGADASNPYGRYLNLDFQEHSFFGPNELTFLKAQSIPEITGTRVRVQNHVLDMDITLQPNEVCHLHLVYAHTPKTRHRPL